VRAGPSFRDHGHLTFDGELRMVFAARSEREAVFRSRSVDLRRV
jgi:hypothetical protein